MELDGGSVEVEHSARALLSSVAPLPNGPLGASLHHSEQLSGPVVSWKGAPELYQVGGSIQSLLSLSRPLPALS